MRGSAHGIESGGIVLGRAAVAQSRVAIYSLPELLDLLNLSWNLSGKGLLQRLELAVSARRQKGMRASSSDRRTWVLEE